MVRFGIVTNFARHPYTPEPPSRDCLFYPISAHTHYVIPTRSDRPTDNTCTYTRYVYAVLLCAGNTLYVRVCVVCTKMLFINRARYSHTIRRRRAAFFSINYNAHVASC